MKTFLTLIALVGLTQTAFAYGFISGTSSLTQYSPGKAPYQSLSVYGPVAEELYKNLNAEEHPLSDEHGGNPTGAWKAGEDISCSHNYNQYDCSLKLENGTGRIRH